MKPNQKKSGAARAKLAAKLPQKQLKAGVLKESAPLYKSPFKKRPFPELRKAYEAIVEKEKQKTYQDRVQDWTHVKQSNSGYGSPMKPVTLVSPATGNSVRI